MFEGDFRALGLVRSGAVTNDAALSGAIRQRGGEVVTVPVFNQLQGRANISNDSNTDATPGNITTHEQKMPILMRNFSYGVKNVVQQLRVPNALQNIRAQFATQWQYELNSHIIDTIQGLIASNIAANPGHDLASRVKDVYRDDTGDADNNRFSRDTY